GEPWSSQSELVTGEIGDDLANYFVTSEQVPSSVGLGVLVDRDQSVRQAGGFIVQLMPGCPDETIDMLEKNLGKISSVTGMLEKGMTPEQILEQIFDGMGLEINDSIPTEFYCNCDRERVEKVLLCLGKDEMQSLIDEGEDVELACHFCGKKYKFSVDEMRKLLEEAV
ncbi:MAG: Hsp33 family molecular chaperone HslO, partial [Coriobacteriales bacterium]